MDSVHKGGIRRQTCQGMIPGGDASSCGDARAGAGEQNNLRTPLSKIADLGPHMPG